MVFGWQDIPFDIGVLIFLNLDLASLVKVSRVCKNWNKISNAEKVYVLQSRLFTHSAVGVTFINQLWEHLMKSRKKHLYIIIGIT